MALSPAPLQPSPQGGAPRGPSHSPETIQAGPGGAESPPHTSRASDSLPRILRPRRVRWRGSELRAPASLKLLASSLPRLPPLRLPAPRPGRPMPARPLPPGYIRSPRSRPRPGPEGRGGRGSWVRQAVPLQPRAGHQRLDGLRADGDAAHSVPLPSPARTPAHPPVSETHEMGAGEFGVGVPGPPLAPCPLAPLTSL